GMTGVGIVTHSGGTPLTITLISSSYGLLLKMPTLSVARVSGATVSCSSLMATLSLSLSLFWNALLFIIEISNSSLIDHVPAAVGVYPAIQDRCHSLHSNCIL